VRIAPLKSLALEKPSAAAGRSAGDERRMVFTKT
jgi:hypothetical protein